MSQADATRREVEDAARHVQRLEGASAPSFQTPRSVVFTPPIPIATSRRVEEQRRLNADGVGPATSHQEVHLDQWIDDYVTGRAPTDARQEQFGGPVIRVELPRFSGRALDWLGWIDLFHFLVHQTSHSAGENLAVLKSRLLGTAVEHLVHGLGGRDGAYQLALCRLKDFFGKRDVMRAAHMQALERIEFLVEPGAFQ